MLLSLAVLQWLDHQLGHASTALGDEQSAKYSSQGINKDLAMTDMSSVDIVHQRFFSTFAGRPLGTIGSLVEMAKHSQ